MGRLVVAKDPVTGKTYDKEFSNAYSDERIGRILKEKGWVRVDQPQTKREVGPGELPDDVPDEDEEYSTLGTVGDVAASAALAVPRGAINATIGLPGNLEALARAGVDYAGGAMGYDPQASQGQFLPTGNDIESGIESVTGEWYDPKTAAGRAVDFGVQAAMPFGMAGKAGKLGQALQKAPIDKVQKMGKGISQYANSGRAGLDAVKAGAGTGAGAYGGGNISEWAGIGRAPGEAIGGIIGGASFAKAGQKKGTMKVPDDPQVADDLATLGKEGVDTFLPSQISDDIDDVARESQALSVGGKGAAKVRTNYEEGLKQTSRALLDKTSEFMPKTGRKLAKYQEIMDEFDSGKINAVEAARKTRTYIGERLDLIENKYRPKIDDSAADRIEDYGLALKKLTGNNQVKVVTNGIKNMKKNGRDVLTPEEFTAWKRKLRELTLKHKTDEVREYAGKILEELQDSVTGQLKKADKTKYTSLRDNYRNVMRLLDEQQAPEANPDYFRPDVVKKIAQKYDKRGYNDRRGRPFERIIEAGARRQGKSPIKEQTPINPAKELGLAVTGSSVGAAAGNMVGLPVIGGAAGFAGVPIVRSFLPRMRANELARNMDFKTGKSRYLNELVRRYSGQDLGLPPQDALGYNALWGAGTAGAGRVDKDD